MRTIILGLMGATMLGSVAQAACNDIPNPTRFNPTELSAYQECWLDTYKAEETAGIIGSLAWVRLNDEYFSAPISLIRKMKGSDYADKFFAAIEDDLIEVAEKETQERIIEIETIIEYVDKIVEDTTRISELEAEVASLEVLNATLTTANTTLSQMIADKEAEITAIWSGVQATQAHMSATYGEDWEYDSITNNQQLQSWIVEIANMHASDLATAQTIATQATIMLSTEQEAHEALKAKVVKAKAQSTDVVAFTNTSINNVMPNLGEDWYDFSPATNSTFQTTLDTFANGQDIVDVTAFGSTLTFVDVDGTWMEANDRNDIIGDIDVISQFRDLNDTITNAIKAQVNAAYDDGYADGYADGYDDGYAQGVTDTQSHL